ncbi:hypothetical protein DXG01_006236 [Tephrocybe rancida]|nr:hypothetical protein DXG01_006236 [Tephrocybe rancida]
MSDPWWRFVEDAGESDLVYYHGLGNSILVLNSLEANIDLFIRKGKVYSARPFFVVACQYLDLIKSVALLPIGPFWRLQRKFTRAAFNPEKVNHYEDTITTNAIQLVESLVKDPGAFFDHVRLASGRVLMHTVYGFEVDSPHHPYILRPKQSMDLVRKAMVPGAFLVDLIPSLNYLPKWTPYLNHRREGLRGRYIIAANVKEPFEHVKRNIESGIAEPSFTSDVLTNDQFAADREQREEFELNVKWASASMFAAGQEVIAAVTLTVILAMVTNPEMHKKAQDELKMVLGPRTPTFKDRDDLPYVHAIIKEILRWRPPLPVSIVRASNQDDIYRGYFIPKKTIIIPNLWALSRASVKDDPEYSPETFAPERFLRENPPMDPSTYVFGFGRRLDIMPCIDESGKEIPVNMTYPSGFLSFPEPFRCMFKSGEGM